MLIKFSDVTCHDHAAKLITNLSYKRRVKNTIDVMELVFKGMSRVLTKNE